MPTQDQHQYHFKLSDMRTLTCAVSAIHTHTHATKRSTFIIGLKHNYHHRQSSPQISIQTKLCQNAAFLEALGTFSNSPRSNFSLMLCMVNCHLYANACVYGLRTCLLDRRCIIIITIFNINNNITIFPTVHVWCARIWAQ